MSCASAPEASPPPPPAGSPLRQLFPIPPLRGLTAQAAAAFWSPTFLQSCLKRR